MISRHTGQNSPMFGRSNRAEPWPERTGAGLPAHVRQGTLLMEVIVASVMLGAVSVILLQSLHAVSRQRQSIRFQTLAAIELNNIYEQLADPADPPQPFDSIRPGNWFLQRYPRSLLTVEPVTFRQSLIAGERPDPSLSSPAGDDVSGRGQGSDGAGVDGEIGLRLQAIRLTLARDATGDQSGGKDVSPPGSGNRCSIVVWIPASADVSRNSSP